MCLRNFLILLLALVVGLSAGAVRAGVWTAATEPDVAPTDPLWDFTGELYDRTFVQDEYLRIDTLQEGADGYHAFGITDGRVSDWDVKNAVEFRTRIGGVKEGAAGAGSLSVYSPNGDGTCNLYQVRLGDGQIGLQDETRTFIWSSVNTSNWHDYTLVVDPAANGGAGEMLVYQDGIFIDKQKPRPNVGLDWNGIRWGDLAGSDEAGISDWNRIAWGTDAVIPEPPPILNGDLNGDGFVGGDDLDIIRANWGQSASSTPPTYAGTWDASALPDASTPAWEFRVVGTADDYRTLVTSGEDAPYLNINTPATFGSKTEPGAYCDYGLVNTVDLDLSQATTVDVTMRVNGQSDPPDNNDGVNAITFYVPDGTGGCYLYSYWVEDDSIDGYALDTSQWHDYRFQLQPGGEDAELFIDGEAVAATTKTPSHQSTLDYNGIRFGDVSDSRSGDADWQFIGWADGLYTLPLEGDINGDGFVGGDDLDVVRSEWGQGTPPAPTSVPEPSVLTLLATAGVLGILLRGITTRK